MQGPRSDSNNDSSYSIEFLYIAISDETLHKPCVLFHDSVSSALGSTLLELFRPSC